MRKVLFVATVYRFFGFERSDMMILKDMGYEIHLASDMTEDGNSLYNDIGVVNHQIDFSRLPFTKQSLLAYRQLKQLMDDIHFEMIHCHTPVASATARLAARSSRKKGTKVVYTDHGFHFHKTSGWKNWVLYYPIEYVMAMFTDMIITINKEDWEVIQKFRTKEKRYIPGVGVDVACIQSLTVDRRKVRQQFGLPENAFVILSIGELSARKNHEVIIRALAKTNKKNLFYIICGDGEKKDFLENLAKELNISDQVILAGPQPHETVLQLCHAVDVGAIPSLIEGLALAGIEPLAAGKPVLGSNVHGIKDYVINEETGISCPPRDADAFCKGLLRLYNDKNLYVKCSRNAFLKAKEFDISIVRGLMRENYVFLLGN